MKKSKLAGLLIASMLATGTFSGFAAAETGNTVEVVTENETQPNEVEKSLEAELEEIVEEPTEEEIEDVLLMEESTPSDAFYAPENVTVELGEESGFYTPENVTIELDEKGKIYVAWDKPEKELEPKSVVVEMFGNDGREGFDGKLTSSIKSGSDLKDIGGKITADAAVLQSNAYVNESGDYLRARVIYSLDKKLSYNELKNIPEDAWGYSEDFIYEPIGEQVPGVDSSTITFHSDGTVTFKKVSGEHAYGHYYCLYKKERGAAEETKKWVVSGVMSWFHLGSPGDGEAKLSSFKDKYEPGYEYQLEMRTLADLNVARNSDFVASDWWNPSGDKNETIDELLNKEGDELKQAVEEKKLNEEELGQMRTDLIASDKVAEKYKELEEKYMQAAGIEKPSFDTGDSGVDGAAIEILGAGMNKIEEIKFSKTELPEELPGNLKENAVSMDISAFMESNEKSELQYPVSITMPVPEGLSATGLTIYHYLENGTVERIYPRDNKDGTITFAITHFSTFIFNPEGEGEKPDVPDVPDVPDEPDVPDVPDVPDEPDVPSGGGSGSGSSHHSGSSGVSGALVRPNGTWKNDAQGWWFEKTAGDYPVNSWYECYWNGEMNWYHFNGQGYLESGWFTGSDGNTYYLHDRHDSRFGYMYTGWNWIDGTCYYFMPYKTADGLPVGAMLRNAVTSDGYTVNENGQWTVNGVVQTK